MKLSSRERFLILVLVNVAIVVVGFIVFIQPSLSLWYKHSAQQQQLAHLKSQRQNSLDEADFIVQQIANSQATQQTLSTRFLPHESHETLHVFFEQMAERSGLVMGNVKLEKDYFFAQPGYIKANISFDCVGTQEQIQHFLKQVESLDKCIALHEMSLYAEGGTQLMLVANYGIYMTDTPPQGQSQKFSPPGGSPILQFFAVPATEPEQQ